MTYTGRFAPSPTGVLHFGSLLAALASFLDARSNRGRWLLRIEDLDPPREQPGASDNIIRTLEQFGFHWDGPIAYQSDRHALYRHHLKQLLQSNQAYRCACSRRQLTQREALHHYDGHCQRHPPDAGLRCAVRLHVDETRQWQFTDGIQGQRLYPPGALGDFILYRRDGFYAYHLAVVCDDIDQRVTHIVRGADLVDETPRHLALYASLNRPVPSYSHIPLLTNAEGQKLSKQTLAPALELGPAAISHELYRALQLLGQHPPGELDGAPASELLAWGVCHWQPSQVPATLPAGCFEH